MFPILNAQICESGFCFARELRSHPRDATLNTTGIWGAFHKATCQWFPLTNCYKLLKSLNLIGWWQICQWKSLTKSFVKHSPGFTNLMYTKVRYFPDTMIYLISEFYTHNTISCQSVFYIIHFLLTFDCILLCLFVPSHLVEFIRPSVFLFHNWCRC